MAVIRAQPLPVQRVPHVGVVILGTAVNMQEQPEFYPQTYIDLFHRSNANDMFIVMHLLLEIVYILLQINTQRNIRIAVEKYDQDVQCFWPA